MERYAGLLLRLSFVALFVWFGVTQLVNPGMWVAYLPQFLGYLPIPGEMIVLMNGWFEIVAAFLLLTGVGVRWIAFILGVHLMGIAITAGGAVGVRDASISLSLFTLWLLGPDEWAIERRFANKPQL